MKSPNVAEIKKTVKGIVNHGKDKVEDDSSLLQRIILVYLEGYSRGIEQAREIYKTDETKKGEDPNDN